MQSLFRNNIFKGLLRGFTISTGINILLGLVFYVIEKLGIVKPGSLPAGIVFISVYLIFFYTLLALSKKASDRNTEILIKEVDTLKNSKS